jgi:hypothetical protein
MITHRAVCLLLNVCMTSLMLVAASLSGAAQQLVQRLQQPDTLAA